MVNGILYLLLVYTGTTSQVPRPGVLWSCHLRVLQTTPHRRREYAGVKGFYFFFYVLANLTK